MSRATGHLYDCEYCNYTYHFSELRKNWKNNLVCEDCWEPMPEALTPPVIRHDPYPVPAIRKATAVPVVVDFGVFRWENITRNWENITEDWEDLG